jgi:hypothetical protein
MRTWLGLDASWFKSCVTRENWPMSTPVSLVRKREWVQRVIVWE